MEIKIGTRVVVRNRPMIVEDVDGDEILVSDEDGMEYTITEALIDHVYDDSAVYDD